MTKRRWDDEAIAAQNASLDPELEALERRADPAQSDFAKLLGESFGSAKGQGKRRFSPGDKVRGEILVLGREEVFLALGPGQEGILERRELSQDEALASKKVGDSLDIFVTALKGGEIRVSLKPTAKNLADDLEDAFDMMLSVEGRVAEVCKGGFRIAIKGKMAFCPISHLDSVHIDKPEDYVGKRFDFRITQFKEGGRDIVVSRRKLLEEERDLAQSSFLEEQKVGGVVSGRVKKIEKFGAFVEVAPGVEGLVHVSELAWSRVQDPSEVVSVGQEIAVKILKIENVVSPEGRGKTKISLSLKQAGAEPWDQMSGELAEGAVVNGKVTRCMKFGAFVQIAPGIEGLVPLSEMSYTKRVNRPEEVVSEGQTVLVKIKEMRRAEKKILLSIKDAGEDPWALADQKFPIGKQFTGIVERREPYGIFVKIEEGVVGLLPKSVALESADFNFDKFKKGDSIAVQVGQVDQDGRRISLLPPGDEAGEDWKAYSAAKKTTGSSNSFSNSLADKLKAALEKKK